MEPYYQGFQIEKIPEKYFWMFGVSRKRNKK